MLDAIRFEERGKPTVLVATSSFVRLANSIKKSMNMEDLPLVVVSHPLGTEQVAAQQARDVADDIVKAIAG
ncbi:MAG: hypothetical protein MK210_08615 [Dehalococcoidia bacterium]|nr:hypothetical protein [Dehalococcoidia bacterium]